MFNFFDAIYCLNLEERKDRLELAYQEFESIGIAKDVIRFDAIKNEMGWKGARDSHVAIIKDAKEKKLSNILILEDDIIVLEKDLDYYRDLLISLNSLREFHLFYLSANTHLPLVRHNKYLFKAKSCLTTHSICYNSSVFDKIITDYEDGKIQAIDMYLMEEIQPLSKSYIASRFCTTQRNDYSDIERQKINYDFMVGRFNKNVPTEQ